MELPFVIIGLSGPMGAGCSTLANCIENIQPSQFIKDKKLREEVNDRISVISKELKDIEDNSILQEKHHELIELLKKRLYLNVLMQLNGLKFLKISMSELIIKFALENMNTKEYQVWKNKNDELSTILQDVYDKHKDDISLYNKYKIAKEFNLLLEEDLNRIDEMFKAIKEARDQFGRLEQIKFFSGETEMQGFTLQEFGDNLRRTGNPFADKNTSIVDEANTILAFEANQLTKFYKNRRSGKIKLFIIDAFRNPLEVEYFSRRYEQFYLISLSSDQNIRQLRYKAILENIEGPSHIQVDSWKFQELFKIIDRRDWGDNPSVAEKYRQNVSRCSYLADISIFNNDCVFEAAEYNIYKNFLKYLALIISPGCIQPTKEETYMNLAYSLSLRSTCISRQVGAVITDANGYVLGQGWNDVGHGQIGCGLRIKKDFDDSCLFHTDILKNEIKDELTDINPEQLVCFKDLVSSKNIRDKLNKVLE